MALVQLNWRPNKKELRSFGAIFMGGFVIIGLVKYFWPFERILIQNKTAGLWIIGMGLVVGALGLTGTKVALPFYWVWLSIAWVMGNIMSRVIITAIYFLVFTPMRVLSNLAGRDKLQLKKTKTASYWQDISLPKEADRYERQF
ncbi:MAG: hypothetical protein ABIO36_04325 [Pyrinomonadaceae bacterium]